MKNTVIHVYTDGSCKKTHGSYGAYLICGSYEKKISGVIELKKHHSSNTMELIACSMAMKEIKNKTVRTIIFTDSITVLKGIKFPKKRLEYERKEWKEFDAEMQKFNSITFIKVKGHSGVIGNEIADALCTEAYAKKTSI